MNKMLTAKEIKDVVIEGDKTTPDMRVFSEVTSRVRSVEENLAIRTKIEAIIVSNLGLIKIIRAARLESVPAKVTKFFLFYDKLEELAKTSDVDFDVVNQVLVLSHSAELSKVIALEELSVLSVAATSVLGIKVKVSAEHFKESVRLIIQDEYCVTAQSFYQLPTILKDLYVDVINSRKIRYGSY